MVARVGGRDLVRDKKFADGTTRSLYMVFLLFGCTMPEHETIVLSEEHSAFRWVSPGAVATLRVGSYTLETLRLVGFVA